ncbi:unnamed protein product [Linum trigynum]|uniref:Uncharacterized protein n=1 Tax=Linum trigynum TaxID=586398 RepID=A0AAV2DL23_9ROSI
MMKTSRMIWLSILSVIGLDGFIFLINILFEYVHKLDDFPSNLISGTITAGFLVSLTCLYFMTAARLVIKEKKQKELIRLLKFDSVLKNRVLELKKHKGGPSFPAAAAASVDRMETSEKIWIAIQLFMMLCYVVDKGLSVWLNISFGLAEEFPSYLIYRCTTALFLFYAARPYRMISQLVEKKQDQLNRLLPDPIVRNRVLELEEEKKKKKKTSSFAASFDPEIAANFLFAISLSSFMFCCDYFADDIRSALGIV